MLDALEIAIFGDGDELGWHYDNSEFSSRAARSVHLEHHRHQRAGLSPGC